MKKLIIILVCFVLVGCFNNQVSVQDEYFQYLRRLEKSEDFSNSEAPVKIEITREASDISEYHYSIIISEPEFKMEKLKIIAYPIGFKNDGIVPNFNILEEVDITTFNNNEAAIKLNYFSDNEYSSFKVLLAFQYDGSYHEEIFLRDVIIK